MQREKWRKRVLTVGGVRKASGGDDSRARRTGGGNALGESGEGLEVGRKPEATKMAGRR